MTLAAFGWIDWGVLALYMAGVVAVGAVVARQHRGGDKADFFLGGRSMPVWAVALSVVATTLSAATFIGAPYEAFASDLSYLILNLGGILAAIIAAFVFIPIFYKAGTTTIYGYLGQRFGPGAMVAGSAAFLAGRLLASGTRLFMAGLGFSLILFGSIEREYLMAAIVLFGIVGGIYTVCGGIRAVIWTDVAQITIVIGAAVLSVWLLLNKIPLSPTEIIAVLGDEVSAVEGHAKTRIVNWAWDWGDPHTVWTGVFAVVFLNLGWYATDHDLVQRIMACRTPWRGSLSLMLSILVSLPVTALFMVIGLLLYVFYARPDVMGAAAPAAGELSDATVVYPLFLLNHLPAGLSGLAMAGLFAVAMGSLDSAMNAMAASAVSDLYEPWRRGRMGGQAQEGKALRTPRLAVAFMGAALVGVALMAAVLYDPAELTLIRFAMGVMVFAYAGLVGVFLTAAFTRRGNTASVIAALLAGAATVAWLQYGMPAWDPEFELAWPWRMVAGTAVSFGVCIMGQRGITQTTSTLPRENTLSQSA